MKYLIHKWEKNVEVAKWNTKKNVYIQNEMKERNEQRNIELKQKNNKDMDECKIPRKL